MHVAFLNPQGNFDPNDSYWTAHPDFGGQLVYVKELALAMGDLGHRVDIVTRKIVDPEWPEFSAPTDSYPDAPNVRILRIPCGPERFLPKEELWPYLGEWAGNVLRRYRAEGSTPDFLTGHYADGGLCAAVLEECLGVPFAFAAHSLGAWKLDYLLGADDAGEAVRPSQEKVSELDARYDFGARIAAERAAMERAAAVVVNSETERRVQYDHPAYRDVASAGDGRRFAVIPPGVNHAVFDPAGRGPREHEVHEKIEASLRRDLPPGRRHLPAVIAWSRLDPKKNHLALVRAFTRSPALRERANLVAISRGIEDPLRDTSPASGTERRVILALVEEIRHSELWGTVSAFSLAGQEALAALYRWGVSRGSVFCLPATYEPFGLSLAEAMATGLPVVATRNGGPQEITAGGEAGLLADPHDPDDLAAGLLKLLDDRESWQAFALRGRERAGRYSWESTAAGYLELAREALQGERAGCGSSPLPDFLQENGEPPRLTSWQPGYPAS